MRILRTTDENDDEDDDNQKGNKCYKMYPGMGSNFSEGTGPDRGEKTQGMVCPLWGRSICDHQCT